MYPFLLIPSLKIYSFKEGITGASTGKLAGALNNASKGMIETNIGNYI